MIDPNAEKISAFLEDVVMYSAIRQILEKQFDLNDPINAIDDTLTNEVIGEITRARMAGRSLLHQGFKELDIYRKDPPQTTNSVSYY